MDPLTSHQFGLFPTAEDGWTFLRKFNADRPTFVEGRRSWAALPKSQEERAQSQIVALAVKNIANLLGPDCYVEGDYDRGRVFVEDTVVAMLVPDKTRMQLLNENWQRQCPGVSTSSAEAALTRNPQAGS